MSLVSLFLLAFVSIVIVASQVLAFDIELPTNQKAIHAGDEVTLYVKVTQRTVDHPDRHQVRVTYAILDEFNQTLKAGTQYMDLLQLGSLVLKIRLPENLQPGNYQVEVSVYDSDTKDRLAGAVRAIDVVEQPWLERHKMLVYSLLSTAIFIVIVAIGATIYSHARS